MRGLIILSVLAGGGGLALGLGGRRRRRRRPSLPALLPLVYFGVMGAPIYGRGLVPGTGDLVDFDTLAPRGSPNEYLVAPFDRAPAFDDDEKREVAPTFPVGVDELRFAFEAALRKRMLPGFGDVFGRPTKSDGRRFVYVERTPLLRFPDVLNVEFVELGAATSTLILHSGSVYGYSDVGKNRARVGELLDAIRDLPPSLKRRTVAV